MLHDSGNPYLDWILALRATRPEVDLTDSGLQTPLHVLGPVDPAALEPRSAAIREALWTGLANHYGRPREELSEALGTSGALYLVFAAFQEPGAAVLVESPTYGALEAVPRALGFRVDRFERDPRDGYAVDPERVLAACGPDTRVVAVTDTHNPSGRAAGDRALRELAGELDRRGVTLFVDEAYRDYRDVPLGTARSLGEHVVTASSLTKVYGFSELRLGWVLGPPAVAARIERIRRLQQVVNPWPPVAYGAAAVDRLPELRQDSRNRAANAWGRFHDWCAQHHMDTPVCDGGVHAWLPVPSGKTGTSLCDRLLREYGVALVPGRFFGVDSHVRLGLGGPPDRLEQGLNALWRVWRD